MDKDHQEIFDVLQQLEWTVRYQGTFDKQSRTFTLGAKAGIEAQPAGPAHNKLVIKITEPLSNAVSTFANAPVLHGKIPGH